jgi:N-acylneuraminate cytidylyltransferase
LATDTASSADVALHALEWYAGAHGEVDGLMLLQPTSPFRRRETVLTGIDLFREHQGRPVVGVSPASSHPFWCYEIKEGVLRPLVDGADTELRSQDLPPAYVVNGVFYLVAPGDLRRAQSFQYPDMAPLIVEDPKESIDIDTEWDWRIAEAALPLIDGH